MKRNPNAIELDARGASDAYLIAAGAFAPLTGFMTYDQARSVVEKHSRNSRSGGCNRGLARRM